MGDERCVVTRVVDGDTVRLRCGHVDRSIRLTGFDTPETYRSKCLVEKRRGQKATRFLEAQLKDAQTITPRFLGTDKYNRGLVDLKLDGRPLKHIMVDAGLAVYYEGGKRINWCKQLGLAE